MKPRRKLSPTALHPKEPTPCFLLGATVYLPDYFKAGVWHGPGGRTYKKADMLTAFPVFKSMMLWERPYVVDVRA